MLWYPSHAVFLKRIQNRHRHIDIIMISHELDHIETHKDSLGWAFVLLGKHIMAKTLFFEVNLG